ncbi:MAG TPA: GFA family protein [Rhizomicrobium sp.]|jgi:hypothetical protein
MIEASCHCGAVSLRVEEPPETVTSCNCSLCRRTGGLWAYYKPAQVEIEGETDFYMWGDKSLRSHRCKICGIITHWSPVDHGLERMGVNARLMAPEVLAAARVRKFDGADSWTFLDEG